MSSAAIFVGFDSAWAGRKPGAICSAVFDGGCFVEFCEPVLVGFKEALIYINSVERSDRPTLVALDQPTIVPNTDGMRPVERVVSSLISWIGGGVQPANRSKPKMFGPLAPIWSFLEELRAEENPEAARTAMRGRHLMEVYPALALASLDKSFFGRLKGPHYNPGRRKTFKIENWRAVIAAARNEATRFGCSPMSEWLDQLAKKEVPKKTDQDRLDAALCLLIAIRWRLGARDESIVVGDLHTGYMVAPASVEVRDRLQRSSTTSMLD